MESKSKPYVYDNRHGISIIDLEKTYDQLEKASQAIEEVVANGKQILLVGTKRQAQEPIRELAAATNMPFALIVGWGTALILKLFPPVLQIQEVLADGRRRKLG